MNTAGEMSLLLHKQLGGSTENSRSMWLRTACGQPAHRAAAAAAGEHDLCTTDVAGAHDFDPTRTVAHHCLAAAAAHSVGLAAHSSLTELMMLNSMHTTAADDARDLDSTTAAQRCLHNVVSAAAQSMGVAACDLPTEYLLLLLLLLLQRTSHALD